MVKPTFIIAGERRSGTSTLAKWIEAHPEVYLNPKLDQAFFLDDELRGRREWMEGSIDFRNWRNNHTESDYLQLFKEGGKYLALGEKSADYFFWEPCLERVLTYCPNIKIILTFRNPVERAWSHYWNEVGKGRENLSFERALEKESERGKNSDYALLHLSYQERGKYINSLLRWQEKISPSNLHIVILEHLIKNPEAELQKVYSFLEVNTEKGLERAGQRFNNNWTTIPYSFWKTNSAFLSVESKINGLVKKLVGVLYKDPYVRRKHSTKWERLTRLPQQKIKMRESTKESLIKEFEPYTQRLENHLGINLKMWRE